ncbi:hypothetical protein D3C87_2080810 [compost metagenome]
MVIVIGVEFTDGFDAFRCIAHSERVFHQLEHLRVVAAVANRHALLRRDIPAFQQAADAVGFMQARNDQINKAEAAGDRFHDAV